MLKLNDLFEILTEKDKLENKRIKLNTTLEDLKNSNELLYKKLVELDKQLALGQFSHSQVIVELNKTNEFNAIEQLEEIFSQLEKYYSKKKEIDSLFRKLMVFFKSIDEMHDYLFGMLKKQKKLSDILNDLRNEIQSYMDYHPNHKNIDIQLLINLCEELGSFFPYPLLQYDKADNDLVKVFTAHETYLIQFYLLFSENNNSALEENQEKDLLIKYLFMQIQLGLLYEKNSALLNDFFNNYCFTQAFLDKHEIKGHLNISQLLIEPIQYFPRFILLLSTLVDKLKIFQLDSKFDLTKMLSHVHEKISILGINFNKFLECHYPDEIHLFFLEKMIKESLLSNKNLPTDNQSLSELCIQQTLRTDRLRIIDKYMNIFLDYLKAYTDHKQRYFMYLFRANTETIKLAEEWRNSSPEYVKIFNENQHNSAKPSLIFQEGLFKLYQTAIQLLINHHTSNLDTFSKYSLSSFIMAYIMELEDTMLHILDNANYVPNFTNLNIEKQLDKLGEHTIDRQNKYHYYQNLHATIWEKTTNNNAILKYPG